MSYDYKSVSTANRLSRKTSAGKALWHKKIQNGYRTQNGEEQSWMQKTILG